MPTLVSVLEAGWLVAVADSEQTGVSAETLAAGSNAPPMVTYRLMRLPAAATVVNEVEHDVFAATPDRKPIRSCLLHA